jgi:HSP20 family protein
MPGVKQDDVKVEVLNNVLTISGERRQEREEDSEGIHRMERSYGSFSRSIPVPDGADLDKARANFQNGVLELAIPLPNSKQMSKQIPIQAGGSAADTSSLRKNVEAEGQQSKAS